MALSPFTGLPDAPRELYGRFQNIGLYYIPRMGPVVCENQLRRLMDVLNG